MPKLRIVAAIALLGASVFAAAAQTSRPGSVDPAPTAPAAPTPAPATTTEPDKATEAGTVKKKAKRRHRYARYRTWRHGFFIPPPQYWFRPWPRYRYARHGRRHRYHHRHYRAGFPFFSRFRW